MSRLAALALSLALAADPAWAQYRFHDREDGISSTHFDVGLGLKWPADHLVTMLRLGGAGAMKPLATFQAQSARVHQIDVTAWANQWLNHAEVGEGLLLRMVQGSYVSFHSREDPDLTLRPQLLLLTQSGQRRYLEAAADAALDWTSVTGLGQRQGLLLKGSSPLALRFDPPASLQGSTLQRALLVLVRTPDPAPTAATIEVHRLDSPLGDAPVQTSTSADLARRLGGLDQVRRDADTLFSDDFESTSLNPRWTVGMPSPAASVETDPVNGFVPLHGRALKVVIPKGQQLGLDLRYKFAKQTGNEPEDIHLRYYLRLSRSWLHAIDGGKLPGLAGTYGLASWGGRPWDGYKGWSMRGDYHPPPPGHPATGRIMLGSYAYHSRSNQYGETVPWAGSGLISLVQPDRWYCIEQRLKLNTPGRQDGLLQVWVDGQLVHDQRDLRLRDVPEIRIEEAWMNVFHGGKRAAPETMVAYLDAVVIARRYIGPLPR